MSRVSRANAVFWKLGVDLDLSVDGEQTAEADGAVP